MSAPENNIANDPDQSNDDGLDQTTPNDNAELDKINAATQAAEPAFTLNYENEPAEEEDKDSSGSNKSNLKG